VHGALAVIQSALARYGYWAVLGAIFLEDFGLPLPGETMLITGSLLAASGQLHIVPLLLVAWVAAVAGDNVGFAIGCYGGRRLVLRLGRRLRLTPERLQEAEERFRRFGPFVVVFARFIDILRQLNGILAGIGGMPWPRFLLFNALGAALWVGFWGTLIYVLGRHAGSAVQVFKRYELPVMGGLLLTGALVLTVRFLLRRRRGKRGKRGG
jgi:membrane protein DedA with SNARE-associated domain